MQLPSETNINIGANDNKSEESILNLELNRLPLKLRRAFSLIEDEEREKASEYFESILDEDPENAYAYLGKAMIKAHVSSPENISTEEICAICKLRSFSQAAKFADEELSRIIDNWKTVGSE